jgi:hypothetical protein
MIMTLLPTRFAQQWRGYSRRENNRMLWLLLGNAARLAG